MELSGIRLLRLAARQRKVAEAYSRAFDPARCGEISVLCAVAGPFLTLAGNSYNELLSLGVLAGVAG
jgi:hypothetical protein